MAVNIVSPGMTLVTRRSKPADTTSFPSGVLSGRWVALNASGRAILPGTQRRGLYLALEGQLIHTGSASAFGAVGTGYASTTFTTLPSGVASNEVALVKGPFVFSVGPEGVDPTAAGSMLVGTEVASDAYGRLVNVGSEDTAIGMIESVTLDGGGLISSIVINVYGK